MAPLILLGSVRAPASTAALRRASPFSLPPSLRRMTSRRSRTSRQQTFAARCLLPVTCVSSVRTVALVWASLRPRLLLTTTRRGLTFRATLQQGAEWPILRTQARALLTPPACGATSCRRPLTSLFLRPRSTRTFSLTRCRRQFCRTLLRRAS